MSYITLYLATVLKDSKDSNPCPFAWHFKYLLVYKPTDWAWSITVNRRLSWPELRPALGDFAYSILWQDVLVIRRKQKVHKLEKAAGVEQHHIRAASAPSWCLSTGPRAPAAAAAPTSTYDDDRRRAGTGRHFLSFGLLRVNRFELKLLKLCESHEPCFIYWDFVDLGHIIWLYLILILTQGAFYQFWLVHIIV